MTVLVLVLTSAYSQANLTWYRDSTHFYLHELLAVTPGQPQDYKGLVLVSDLHKYPQLEQRINIELGLEPTVGILTLGTAPRWIAVSRQAGFQKTRLCTGEQTNQLCEAATAIIPGGSPASPSGLYSATASVDGWFVIRLNTNFKARSQTP